VAYIRTAFQKRKLVPRRDSGDQADPAVVLAADARLAAIVKRTDLPLRANRRKQIYWVNCV
jgi:hypothetical protein